MKSQQLLTSELHKPVKHNFQRLKVKSFEPKDILAIDLVDMNLFKENEYRYILTAQDIFTKYSFAIPLKTKTSDELIKVFKQIFKILKPNKIWCDEESAIYSNTFQVFLMENNISLYSTGSEIGVSIIERFNRTLKEWMWKEFTKNSNTKWLKILPKLVKKYNNRIHSTIKVKPIDAFRNPEIIKQQKESKLKIKKPNFKIGDRVRIYRYKTEFEKGYTTRWSKEIFIISNIRNTNPITYFVKDLNDDLISVPSDSTKGASFYKEQLQKTKF